MNHATNWEYANLAHLELALMCTDDKCNESTKSCENPTANCLASDDLCATDICNESLNGCQFTCGATLETWLSLSGLSVDNIKIAIVFVCYEMCSYV
jgi:hypothetical protein